MVLRKTLPIHICYDWENHAIVIGQEWANLLFCDANQHMHVDNFLSLKNYNEKVYESPSNHEYILYYIILLLKKKKKKNERIYMIHDIWSSFKLHLPKCSCNFDRIFKCYSQWSLILYIICIRIHTIILPLLSTGQHFNKNLHGAKTAWLTFNCIFAYVRV